MFPKIHITEEDVKIEFSLLNKFLNASPRDLTILKHQIVSIDSAAHIVRELKGFRCPGTYGFGFCAGTFRKLRGVKHFWNARVKFADQTIRFNLTGHKYKSIVIQVNDPVTISKSLERLKESQ